MDGKGTVVPIQHATIVPVIELPVNYRKEIDPGSSTGWKCLDWHLKGLRKGELTVVTADTGVGKTTFCTQLMVNCAMGDCPVWINSWEMRPEIMVRKLASIILRKPMKLKDFTNRESEEFDEWANRYKVYINPSTQGTTLESLFEDLIIAHANGVRIVMLDHLDYLVKYNRAQLHEAIEETVKKLHEYAFNLHMHIILICHPRQSSQNEEIGLHMLKGSSSIKQYADNVIILHRCARTDPQSDPNKVKVRVAKNRMFGTEGNAYLFYQPEWDGYLELKEF
jgi:twinkle protein